MKYRKLAAALVAVVVAGGLSLAASPAAFATEGCPNTGDGWTKVDLAPAPELFQVKVTADVDHLIAETCVKAATDVVFADVDPNAPTAIIVAPSTHAISHYSYRQVPVEQEDPTYTEGIRCEDFVVDVYKDGVWDSSHPATEEECPSPTTPSTDEQRHVSTVPDCDAGTLSANYEVWTTSYTFDRVAKVFVPGEPVLKDSWTVTRPLTEEEQAACPPPEPRICVPAGDWYTEGDDDEPTLSPEGLVFNGGPKAATGLRVTASGNLQGWQPVSYVATGDTELFYFRIVIDSTANGGHPYSSLTVTSGSPVTLASTAYSNKLDTSKTLAEWAEFYPNAEITSVGFHLDSSATPEHEVVLSSVTGPCATADFTSEQPADIVVTVTDDETDCEAGTVTTTTTTTTTPFVWVDDEWITGTPVVTTEDTVRDATEEECPIVVTPTPTPTPTATPVPVVPAAVPPTSTLADTGFDMGPIYAFMLIATLGLGMALATTSAVAIRRRNGSR